MPIRRSPERSKQQEEIAAGYNRLQKALKQQLKTGEQPEVERGSIPPDTRDEKAGTLELTNRQRTVLERSVTRSLQVMKGSVEFDGDQTELQAIQHALREMK